MSYGLIAGLTLTEIGGRLPGFICDMYVLRRRYDDDQHRIVRAKREIYD